MGVIKTTRKYNKSLVYLVPCLMDSFALCKDNLVNSYLYVNANNERPQLVLKYKWTKELGEYERDMIKSPLFKRSIDFDDNHIVFIFDIPEQFAEDYSSFVKGKFSELSPKLKQRIKQYWKINSASTLYKVLTKDETLRAEMSSELECIIPKDAELSSVPNKQEETLYD